MQIHRQSRGQSWIVLGYVILAALFGLFLFVLLNLVTGELLITMITVAVLFVILACAHYWVWGHETAPSIRYEGKISTATAPTAPRLFVIEMDDLERAALLKLLEQSLSSNADKEGPVSEPVYRRIRDKIHDFGA